MLLIHYLLDLTNQVVPESLLVMTVWLNHVQMLVKPMKDLLPLLSIGHQLVLLI
jgi:hypothetical protein